MTMRYHLTLLRESKTIQQKQIIKKSIKMINDGEGMEKRNPLMEPQMEIDHSHYEGQYAGSLKD